LILEKTFIDQKFSSTVLNPKQVI